MRTRPAANPIQFTVDKKRLAASRALNQPSINGTMNTSNANANSTMNKSNGTIENLNEQANFSVYEESEMNPTGESSSVDLEQQMAAMACSLANKDDCMMCGS